MVISSTIFETHAISINCEFENEYYGYECECSVIRNKHDDNVSELFGKHIKGYDESSVIGLRLQKQNLQFFPRNIEKKLPKLAWINLSENVITSVTNVHLRPHQMLIRLDLNGNQITVLESNLFDGLPNLRSVHLKNNDIKHVNDNVRLPPEFYIYVQGNPCIDEDYYSNEIIDLSSILQDKCPPLTKTSQHKNIFVIQ